MIVDKINIDMGEYQIECDKDKVLWRITDKFDGTIKEFDKLSDMMRWLERQIESIVIEY